MNDNRQKGILSVATPPPKSELLDQPEKTLRLNKEPITFDKSDLEGMSQPYDDALVVTSRIGGFLVKRVMIDQGNRAEILYPDLYKGLGLNPKDLSKFDTPLVGFDGKIVVPEGQIRLPIMTKGKEVMVNFIIVNAFLPYTAILGQP